MKIKLTRKEQKQLLELAKEVMVAVETRGDLKMRYSYEDYLEVSVGSIEALMERAYQLGKQQAK